MKPQTKLAYYTLKTRNSGTYLYLYNNIHQKYVTITGIFENPLEVQYYPSCKGAIDMCKDPRDKEFILDPDLLPIVYDMAFDRLLRTKTHATDTMNDDLDDIVQSLAQRVREQRSNNTQ